MKLAGHAILDVLQFLLPGFITAGNLLSPTVNPPDRCHAETWLRACLLSNPRSDIQSSLEMSDD
jgi:hypothetical protein